MTPRTTLSILAGMTALVGTMGSQIVTIAPGGSRAEAPPETPQVPTIPVYVPERHEASWVMVTVSDASRAAGWDWIMEPCREAVYGRWYPADGDTVRLPVPDGLVTVECVYLGADDQPRLYRREVRP